MSSGSCFEQFSYILVQRKVPWMPWLDEGKGSLISEDLEGTEWRLKETVSCQVPGVSCTLGILYAADGLKFMNFRLS